MRNLILMFFVLFAICSNAEAVAEKSQPIETELGESEERWVIVYTMNGATHAVIINRPVCCQCLVDAIELLNLDIVINDCGPINGIQVPSDANYVSEAEALSDFGQEEWPE